MLDTACAWNHGVGGVWVQLLAVSFMSAGGIRVVQICPCCIPSWLLHFVIQSAGDSCLSSLYFLSVTPKAAVNIHAHVCVDMGFEFSQVYVPRSGHLHIILVRIWG